MAISVPLAQIPPGAYLPRHVDGHLNLVQRTTLKRLAVALDQSNARLADGKHVISHIDAVRWLLERIGEKSEVRSQQSE